MAKYFVARKYLAIFDFRKIEIEIEIEKSKMAKYFRARDCQKLSQIS